MTRVRSSSPASWAHRLACVAVALAAATSRASVPEPDTILFGTMTLGGQTLDSATVEAFAGNDLIASSAITHVGSEDLFVLRLPMAFLVSGETDPPPGSVVISDQVNLHVNGVPVAANYLISDRGTVVRFDSSVSGALLILSGTSVGGIINLIVNGVQLSVPTTPGESAATVASNVASAINSDPTLQGQGVAATSQGGEITTNGDVSEFDVIDPGLVGPEVPALDGGWIAVLILVLLLAGSSAARGPGSRRPAARVWPWLRGGDRALVSG